jgi:hypothetical protein
MARLGATGPARNFPSAEGQYRGVRAQGKSQIEGSKIQAVLPLGHIDLEALVWIDPRPLNGHAAAETVPPAASRPPKSGKFTGRVTDK